MRKVLPFTHVIPLFICLLFSPALFSQKRDSLLKILAHPKNEMQRMAALSDYIINETATNPLGVVKLQTDLLEKARKEGDRSAEIVITGSIGYSIGLSGNLGKGTELLFKALEMAEDAGNDQLIGMTYDGLGILFTDPAKKKEFYQKAIVASAKAKDSLFLGAEYGNLASVYVAEGKLDSGLHFNQICMSIAMANASPMPFSLVRAGKINYLMGRKQVAMEYYRSALQEFEKYGNLDNKGSVYATISNYFLQENNLDSALHYARLYFDKVKDSYLFVKMYALNALSKVYEKTNSDSALKYTKAFYAAKDSVFGINRIAQMQGLAWLDEERQRKTVEERSHNLQYTALAFGIVALLIGFFAFSHTVVANQKLIRFLGIIALLIVFEFLNLLLHPWLSAVTDHSPVFMLLAMVCVAALLIPLHHKLEHWITHRLVEKNKKIRLHAAKRTIEKLEQELIN